MDRERERQGEEIGREGGRETGDGYKAKEDRYRCVVSEALIYNVFTFEKSANPTSFSSLLTSM